MSSTSGQRTASRIARVAVVAVAVLALVPAWMAQTGWLWACAMDEEVRAEPCCPSRARPAEPDRDPAPALRAMCCIPDDVSLATTRPASHHDDAPALLPRFEIASVVPAAILALDTSQWADVAPRATGPPVYLRTQSFLL